MMNQANDTDADTGQRERAGTQVRQALDAARERTASAYSSSVERASEAIDSARESVSLAAQRAAQSIEENPVAALVGGLALGVIAGTLLPGTRREAELLGPVGSRVGEAARTAAQAARDAGQAKLDELGLGRESNPVSALIDKAVKVAGEAGNAAVQSVRQGRGGSEA